MAATSTGVARRDDGVVAISGPLLFATVNGVLEGSRALLPATGGAVIDLSAVTHADSSALALIVEWRKLARQRGLALELRAAPAQLRALAAAAGLGALCD